MLNTIRLFFVALSLSVSCFLQGEINEVLHFEELKKYVTPDTLVILDIDNTLIEPVQTLGSDQWFYHQFEGYVNAGMSKSKALEKALAEWTAVQSITKVKTIETNIAAIVRTMQEEGFQMMGLTTRGLGLATRTIEQLQTVSIDLYVNSPCSDDHYFMNGQGILFRKGILFTAGTDKGKTLSKFLALIDVQPKRIVFINDKATHIAEVERMASEQGIPFLGLRYGFTDEKVNHFNKAIADIQFGAFGHIISDEAAEKILLNCNCQSIGQGLSK